MSSTRIYPQLDNEASKLYELLTTVYTQLTSNPLIQVEDLKISDLIIKNFNELDVVKNLRTEEKRKIDEQLAIELMERRSRAAVYEKMKAKELKMIQKQFSKKKIF
jgi:hypothetical protein